MEKDPGTHWIGNWMGHKASLDTVVMGKKYLFTIMKCDLLFYMDT
jgi:hypothetical protein